MNLIEKAIAKGGKIYGSISGGKDGQATVNMLVRGGFMPTQLIHADLGKVEWAQSKGMCEMQSQKYNIPLVTVFVKRNGKQIGLLDGMRNREEKVKGRGIAPFPDSRNRYCTSDFKIKPINKHFTDMGKGGLIISAEGIRSGESKERAKKNPLSIREKITSTYYRGMSVEEAIDNYNPLKRLALNWYPIFDFTTEDVWATEGMDSLQLEKARQIYKATGHVPNWWPFHPAYAMGNERVSCVVCIMGTKNDIANGIRNYPEVAQEIADIEMRSGFTFKYKFNLGDFALKVRVETEIKKLEIALF